MVSEHVTRREAAELLRVDLATVDRWRAGDGGPRGQGVRLRSAKVGRRVLIDRASVEALIQRGERIERQWRARRERVGRERAGRGGTVGGAV